MSYEQWYAKVDAYISAKTGLGIDDLADGPSRDAYDSGETPAEYAEDMLESEGLYEMMG